MKLTPEEKKKQMTNKYNGLDYDGVLYKANADNDLQGFRNFLVDRASRFIPEYVLDLGGGTGDKCIRLAKAVNKKINCDVVDFSEQSPSVKLVLQNFEFLKYHGVSAEFFLENEASISYDVIMMFGFLHEVEDAKHLLSKIAEKQGCNGLLFFSDNTLYKKSEDVLQDFIDCGYCGVFFEKVWSAGHFKIFKGKAGAVRNKYMLMWHRGRVDSVFGVFSFGREVLVEFPGAIKLGKFIIQRTTSA